MITVVVIVGLASALCGVALGALAVRRMHRIKVKAMWQEMIAQHEKYGAEYTLVEVAETVAHWVGDG